MADIVVSKDPMAPPTGERYRSDFTIYMSDPEQENWYPLLMTYTSDTGEGSYEISCVESYEITGGPANPFEYIKMVITKKDLGLIAPGLKVLECGLNRIALSAVGGGGNYTLTSCRSSGGKYTLTAYSEAEVLRGTLLQTDIHGLPLTLITSILTGPGPCGFQSFDKANLLTNCTEVNQNVTFKKGTGVWRALQICATMLKATISFAEGNCYVCNYSAKKEDRDFTSTEISPNLSFSGSNDRYSLIGSLDQGADGTSSVVNKISGSISDREVTCSDKRSIGRYSERMGGRYDLPELSMDAWKEFADGVLTYLREAQVPVTMTINENSMIGGIPSWVPAFNPVGRIGEVRSEVDDIYLTDRSYLYPASAPTPELTHEWTEEQADGPTTVSATKSGSDFIKTVKDADEKDVRRNAALLCLSSYTRHYPQGYTEYTFGQIDPVSLSSSTSKIQQSIGRRLTR